MFVAQPAMIKREVCREWRISLDEMMGERRLNAVVIPRQVAMALHKALRPHDSLPRIGRSFAHPATGRERDHTTVLNAIRKIGRMSFANPKFAARVDRARERVEDALCEHEAGLRT